MKDSWIQILIIIISMLTLFLSNFGVIWWFRRESKEDWKMMREDWKLIHQEMKEFKEAVRLEMKDFHERLLEIEMGKNKT